MSEPVAWLSPTANPPVIFQQYPHALVNLGVRIEPLYTASPQRKPLTDEEIAQIDWKDGETLHDFARAIEKAHGIGGEE